MALPTTNNPISIQQINYELGVANTTQRSLNDAVLRTLFGVASGAISFSNGWGKSNAPAVTPGSQTFTSSGTFTVPAFNTLTVVVQGGGGAGGPGDLVYTIEGTNLSGLPYGNINPSGTSVVNLAGRYGGTSSFGAYLSASGGQGGYVTGSQTTNNLTSVGGAGGTGSGGDQNYTGSSGVGSSSGMTTVIAAGDGVGGAAGGYGVYANGGASRSAPGNPANDGVNQAVLPGNAGNNYGGGGSGGSGWGKIMGYNMGGGGGGGGLARKTWTNQALAVGSTIAVTVGAGSAQPYMSEGSGGPTAYGSAGAPGIVTITWS